MKITTLFLNCLDDDCRNEKGIQRWGGRSGEDQNEMRVGTTSPMMNVFIMYHVYYWLLNKRKEKKCRPGKSVRSFTVDEVSVTLRRTLGEGERKKQPMWLKIGYTEKVSQLFKQINN